MARELIEFRRLTINLPKAMHHDFKKIALEHNVTMTDLLLRLMVGFIHQQNEINNGPTVSDNIAVDATNS